MPDRVTQTKKVITLADGKEYEIRPLTLKESKDLIPVINKLESGTDELTEDMINNVASMCFIILKKTIKDLTMDRVLELVDLETVRKVVLMASGRSIS